MVTKDIERLLNAAHREAVSRNHRYIVTEHLLFAICATEDGANFLQICDVNLERLNRELELFLENQKPDRRHLQPVTSVMVERIIKGAVEHSFRSEQNRCSVIDVLASMMKEEESYAVSLLKKQNLSRIQVLKQIPVFDNIKKRVLSDPSNLFEAGGGKNPSPEGMDPVKNREGHKPGQGEKPGSGISEEKILREFLIDLNERAKQGGIDPLIGRESEMYHLLLVLGRRKKNNPILVGDPGVGKTAIVEGLARGITDKSVHHRFHSHRVYSLELGSLLAGTKFRGDFEERMTRIFSILKKKRKCIVFIDEIHTLVGSGSTSGNGMDASNLIKPILVSGDIQVIGATTFEEYRNHFQKDSALSRRFEKIEVPEPTITETEAILKSLSKYYSDYHGVAYPEEVLKSIPSLCKNYFLEKRLPDGAIDVLDLAGSQAKMANQNSGIKSGSNLPQVSLKEVEKLISKISGIPLRQIEDKSFFRYSQIVKNIKKQIFGQDHVVERVLKTVKLSKLGLRDPERPIGSFLFTGPTGVGKTELCRVLSQILGMQLIRLDMSEYMEAHSVSRLIGAPPGYIGFNEKGGELTERVNKYPHSLILLDEIEKAHHDVVNAFLQVMDYGRLTDGSGRHVSFQNTMIVMTSNLGVAEMSSLSMGFGKSKTQEGARSDDAVKGFFSPEFRNRLSAVLQFNFLSDGVVRSIVGKLLDEINSALVKNSLMVSMEEEAIDYLLAHGYDPKMGGRSIKRVFEVEVKERIADFVYTQKKAFFQNNIEKGSSQKNITELIFYVDHSGKSANADKIAKPATLKVRVS